MGTKGSLNELMNELITEVFVEQPLVSPGSANKTCYDTFIIVSVLVGNSLV